MEHLVEKSHLSDIAQRTAPPVIGGADAPSGR
jgi:hypothetical protein